MRWSARSIYCVANLRKIFENASDSLAKSEEKRSIWLLIVHILHHHLVVLRFCCTFVYVVQTFACNFLDLSQAKGATLARFA